MNRFKFYHLGNTLATYRVFVNTVTGFGAGGGIYNGIKNEYL